METESALTVYTVIVPGYNVIFAFQMPVKSDRAKSKLEYCGATWLQKQLLGDRDYSTAAHNPTPSLQFPPPTSLTCTGPPCIHVVARWRAGVLAHRAVANVIGDINDVEFGIAQIHANISRSVTSTQVNAVVREIPPDIGISQFFNHTVSNQLIILYCANYYYFFTRGKPLLAQKLQKEIAKFVW